MSIRRTKLIASSCQILAAILTSSLLTATAADAADLIGSQIAETKSYPATARLIVDIPSGFDGPPDQPFTFDGSNLVEFNVSGIITIRQSTPAGSINDPFDGVINAPPMLSAIAQEYVGITGTNIDNLLVASMQLGDGGDDGVDSTPGNLPRSFFSTGGAVEIAPDGTLADAFMNLFMQINVAAIIPVPGDLITAGMDAFYPVGVLYNKDLPLHVEAQISTYQPFHVPFLIPGGSPVVEMFMAADNQFVVDLQTNLGRPATPLRAAIFTFADIRIVPEPSGAVLALLGVAGIASLRRRDTAGKPRR